MNSTVTEFPLRFLVSIPIIFGIISPPFSTKTVSFRWRSSNLIWAWLCNEALFTLVPASCTGSRLATGVIAPVRPTWKETESSLVEAISAWNLYAMAHRGDLAVKPRSCCWLKELTLMTTPSISCGRRLRSLSHRSINFITHSISLHFVISAGILKPHFLASSRFL